MQVTHWNPFREMDELFTGIRRNLARPGGETAPAHWEPAVDISETATEYLVKAELPGVNKDDLKLQVDNGLLTLSGERTLETDNKDAKQHRVERFYGAYRRSFTLPDDVLVDRISADYKDGVLNVHLPKAENRPARKLEVRVQ